MKRITKKLALNKEFVRRLADGELAIAQGGRINPTVSVCEDAGECVRSMHCVQGIV